MSESLKRVRGRHLAIIRQATIMLKEAIYNRRQDQEYN
jgi:hypothetical protein